MNLALSPYDLIVDMPTRTSEKLMKMGDLVTLYKASCSAYPEADETVTPTSKRLSSRLVVT